MRAVTEESTCIGGAHEAYRLMKLVGFGRFTPMTEYLVKDPEAFAGIPFVSIVDLVVHTVMKVESWSSRQIAPLETNEECPY
ncbi:unnamed protein product [Periconia digitata]|uniref:Uncharacterized protein n=1 Tax=Periconia digitata TaxID=1303443 RepID=A0A9W4UMR0_9PLEO|nr:unnamed protein product [Periconia digitata]